MHTHGKANGVVHKEQDLPVTYVLASKGKDHNEYTQKLKRVDVMTTYPVGDFVGVEGPRDARDTVPRLNQASRAKTDGNPPMTQLVVNKLHAQYVT